MNRIKIIIGHPIAQPQISSNVNRLEAFFRLINIPNNTAKIN